MLTSLQNFKVKLLVKLREKKKVRKEEELFIVEGYREIDRALRGGFELSELFYCKNVLSQDAEALLKKQTNTDLVQVSDDVFKKIAVREGSDGLLATFKIPKRKIEDIVITDKSIIVALDGVEKPGNLGAILRSCDAVGVSAIVLLNSKVDSYNPNAVRTSLGALFSVPVFEMDNDDYKDFCKLNRIKTVAASPFASKFHYEEDLKGPVSVVMGSEAFGLSKYWESQSDSLVKIPMNGLCDSLNVSVATAVIIYESLRQQSF